VTTSNPFSLEIMAGPDTLISASCPADRRPVGRRDETLPSA